jgi:(p)ppGpp synthase/HD superfamily hydrolase
MTDRFADAAAYALTLHRDQKRKGSGVPYVAHLLGVASIVLEHGGDEEESIAALLHDAVEDQGGLPTLEEIRRRFGERVADIVLGCSDATVTPKPPWRERKEAYLRHVAGADRSVQLVSCSDKLYNARAILADFRVVGKEVWERFTGGREGSLWYYRSLCEVFKKSALPKQLVKELDRTVRKIEDKT